MTSTGNNTSAPNESPQNERRVGTRNGATGVRGAHAEVAVRVNQSGRDDAARAVDGARAGGYREPGADGLDTAVPNEHGGVAEDVAGDRPHLAAHERDDVPFGSGARPGSHEQRTQRSDERRRDDEDQ